MNKITLRVKSQHMRLRVMGFILGILGVGGQVAQATEPNFLKLRANELKNGYAIKLLKPIPRHNNGCDTVFRNGKALETCDGNFGFDPHRYGGILTFCHWDLHTVYRGNNENEWSTPFFTSQAIAIRDARDEWKASNENEMMYRRIQNVVTIQDRHVSIHFDHPDLGELNCYPGYLKTYQKNSDYYFGTRYFKFGQVQPDETYSGLSIDDLQRQLRSFIEFVMIQ